MLSVYWKQWIIAAGLRSLKAFFTALLPLLLAGNAAINITTIDWKTAIGLATTSALLSLIWSIKGIPEVDKRDNHK